MLYVECTCGSLLANIQLPYLRDMKKLCDDMNVDHEFISNGIKHSNDFDKEKEKIVDKYCDKHRPCCRSKLISYVDIVNLIN